MANTITVRAGGRAEVRAIQRKLADPRLALKLIGAVVAAQGRKAFEDQALGGIQWKERYPNQKGPFINVAPVVRKAGEGRAPTADDFRRRPALGGVGSELAQSIAFEVEGSAVNVGTNFPDAGILQFGGKSRIAITERTRYTIARWLGLGTTSGGKVQEPRGKARLGSTRVNVDDESDWYTEETPDGPNLFEVRYKKKSVKMKFSTVGDKADYGAKLAFVFDPDRDEYEPEAAARPFIGFTDETMTNVMGELAGWLGGEVK